MIAHTHDLKYNSVFKHFVEDEYFLAIENRDTAIMQRDEIISKQHKAIEKQNKALEEQHKALEEQKQRMRGLVPTLLAAGLSPEAVFAQTGLALGDIEAFGKSVH